MLLGHGSEQKSAIWVTFRSPFRIFAFGWPKSLSSWRGDIASPPIDINEWQGLGSPKGAANGRPWVVSIGHRSPVDCSVSSECEKARRLTF